MTLHRVARGHIVVCEEVVLFIKAIDSTSMGGERGSIGEEYGAFAYPLI